MAIEEEQQHYGTFNPPAARKSFSDHVSVAIAEGRPVYATRYVRDEERLPCCNLGIGWFLFAIGFVSIVPWWIGAIIFSCFSHDSRERLGLAACTVATMATILVGGSQFF